MESSAGCCTCASVCSVSAHQAAPAFPAARAPPPPPPPPPSPAHFREGTLRDWDVSVEGAAAVGEANAKIFAAVPAISIEVLSIHVCEGTRTAVCEILVHLGDAGKTSLKVADVIVFNDELKIVALRAYKG